MLRRLLSILWYAGATLVVVAALGFSLARLALPMLESRTAQLETLVKDVVGQDVQLGHLEINWRGLGPELQVHEVVVRDQDTGQTLLTARELRIDFSLLRSLWDWRPVPSRLVLLGSELSLYRDHAGRLAIEGIRHQSPELNPWLLVFGQRHVELRDIRVHWRDARGQFPDLILDNIDLRMRNRGTRHQLDIDMQLPAEYGTRLQVVADLIGATARPEDWSGELYLALEHAPLAQWLAQRLPEDWQVQADLSGALWLDLQGGKLQQLQGKLDFGALRITQGVAAKQLFAAQRVTTYLDWRPLVSTRKSSTAGSTKWILSLDQLQVTETNGDWPQTGLSLAVATSGDAREQIQIAVDYLRIETLMPLVTRLWTGPEEHAELLQKLNPQGELRGLQLAFTRHEDEISEFAYKTRFSELSNTAVEKIPGVSALSGKLAGNPLRGVLELDSHAAHIVFPKLFREPLQLDTLSGRFDWQKLEDRLRIESHEVKLGNADIVTSSRLRLDIPSEGGKPWLDLQSSFANGRVQSTYKYLPVGIMPGHTVEWLDRALVSGRVSSGSALFQGRFGDFPFDHATGRLEVRATVVDTVLDYKAGWHRIEGLDAELSFMNRSMQIQGVAGKVLGSELRNVDVRIEDLAHARLTIQGDAAGSLPDMLRFVRESPLGSDSAKGLGAVQASGNARLHLDLMIPLAEKQPATVEGHVHLLDNELTLPEWGLALEKLQGELQFTQEAVTGQDIRATLLGAPVKLSIEDGSLDGHPMTRVRATGPLPLLEQVVKHSNGVAERLTGTSDWQAAVYIPKQADERAKPTIELRSDLRGIGIDLPQPFGKSEELARTFTLRAGIKPQALGPFLVRYGEHSAALELERDASTQRVERAEIKLSALDAQLPQEQGVRVLGSLPLFVWDEWRSLLKGDAGAGSLNQLDLSLAESSAFGRRFRQLHIKAERTTDGWQAQLEGPDLRGSVAIPAASSAPLRLRLAHLSIPPLETVTPVSTLKPADVPPLDLEVQQLQFHELDLGQVSLTTHPIRTGMAVDALQVNADWMQFTAEGEWTQQAKQDASRFRIEMLGGDLGKMLAAFGYAGSVEGGETKGEINANWPGMPTDFSLAQLEGSLKADVGQGRLLNVETGAGRVFGLLSLHGLRRRLSLDFSDVFEKGFGFDRIQGKFSLLDGDAYTNDLVIEGPAARIEVSGRTGLANHDYDQLVTVIPHVQSTLPLAGAIAGGPVVGAALLLADKLFEQQLDGLGRLARHQYSVTGSWDNPEFQKLPREPARPLPNNKAPSTTGNR